MFDWWDDFALWLTGVPFFVQFALVMAVLVPLCAVVAYVADRVVGWVARRIGNHGEHGS